ncbi:MAG: TetR/AcrR family transcriptional regulator [Opitutaceae bacterium]|nr:TetR/AcrR family transcriptional regulator [Opitutaceae bacterium]
MTDRSGLMQVRFMPTVIAKKTKRDELVEVASKLFYEQGYHRTGIQQIIGVAGIAKGTFYSHFKSKEELGVAWLKARHWTWNGWLSDFIQNKAGSKASSKLMGLFDFLEEWMISCDFRGCAFLNTLAEIPEKNHLLRKEVEAHKKELLETIQSLVDAHFEDKQKKERIQLATIVYILFEGALVEMQNFHEVWPVVAAKKHLKLML